MTTTAAWYRDTGTSPWSGQVGYDGGALVGRFAFTTPATGASSPASSAARSENAASFTDPGDAALRASSRARFRSPPRT